MKVKDYHFISLRQGGTICGAIEGSRRSLKSMDKRVFASFCDKNAVFTIFATKMPYLHIFATKMPYLQIFATNAIFTHFRDKNAVFTKKITFLNYMTKTQCLALILSVQDEINQLIAHLLN